MGLFDIFGGSDVATKARKLRVKLQQKYGDPLVRQKAIEALAALRAPEAIAILLLRFTFAVEPQTTDADEKALVYDTIVAQGSLASGPVTEFLHRSDSASSWAARILAEVLPAEQFVETCVAELRHLGAGHTRDPEKKIVLLQFLTERGDPQAGSAARPLLQDPSDDVKIAAVRAIARVKYGDALEDILLLLTASETAMRVQSACVQALVEGGFPVSGFREKVEARLPPGYVVDRAGLVAKLSSA